MEQNNPAFLSGMYRVNTYRAVQICFEYYLANLIFRGDISRVVWSSDDSILRKRQLSHLNKTGCEDLDIGDLVPDLDIPFANYWAGDGYWRPIRPNSAQQFTGAYVDGVGTVQTMDVETTFSGTLVYDQEAQKNIASELLMWEHHVPGPTLWTTPIVIDGKHVVELPIKFYLETIVTAPDYTDLTWLKQAHLIIMKYSVRVESMLIYYPFQTHYKTSELIQPFNLGQRPSRETQVLSDEVLLRFLTTKQWITQDAAMVSKNEVLDTIEKVIAYEDLVAQETEIKELECGLVDTYFGDEAWVMRQIGVVDVGCDWVMVAFKVSDADLCRLNRLEIYIPGRKKTVYEGDTLRCLNSKAILIDDLEETSVYSIIMTFFVFIEQNLTKTYQLEATTTSCDPFDEFNPIPKNRRIGYLAANPRSDEEL